MALQEQQLAQQEWAPRFDYAQTRKLIKAYDKNPNVLPVEELRQHASYHNVPFYEGDFSLFDAVRQLGGGFFEGFTTFSIADPPDNEYEAVARSLGHLIGFAPGILSGPLRWMGTATEATSLITAAKAIQGAKGAPLYIAEKYITPATRKIVGSALKTNLGARSGTVQTAKNFLLGEQAKSVMEGAFNLGTASAISSWQHGADAIMDGFFHGAIAGGVFRSIGNIIGKDVPKGKKFALPVETEKAEKFARGLAGSVFMGIPSTMRGATTPEQVYDYLMGAYFGGAEKPWTVHKAGKIFRDKVIPASEKDVVIRQTKDAERVPETEWETLEPEVQTELKRMAFEATGQTPEDRTAAAYTLAEKMGVIDKTKREDNVEEAVFKNQEDFEKTQIKVIKTAIKNLKKVPKIEVEKKAPEKAEDVAKIKIVKGTINTKTAARKGEGIYVMRPNKGDNIPLVNEANNFGNPWSSKGYQGAIKVKDIPTSIANYRAWLEGTAHQNIEPNRRKWILDQIDKGVLDGQDLLYFAEGYRSHADELKDFVNKRRRLVDKKVSDKVEPKDREIIHVITGGEEGIPAWFSREAEKRGVTSVQLTHPQQTRVFGKGPLTENIPLNREALGRANKAIVRAAETLGLDTANLDPFSMDAISRDYHKVFNAKTVFVFDNVANNLKSTAGFSKYATQMAVDLGKPIFLFDKNMNTWLKYNHKRQIFDTFSAIPELPQRYTILSGKLDAGTEVNKIDKAAIKGLFAKYDKLGFKEEFDRKMKAKEDIDKSDTEMPDSGERIVTPLDNKMQYTFHRFLGKEIKKNVTTNKELNDAIFKYSEKAGKLADDILDIKDSSFKDLGLENKSEEWANAVEMEMQKDNPDYKIPENMRGDMRKWVTIQKQGAPVRIVNFDGTALEIPDKNFPYTMAGKKKLMVEPIKDIELVWNELTGEETPKEGVYAIMESITQGNRDIELSRYVKNYMIEGGSQEDAMASKIKFISDAIQRMKTQYNMHPFSGYGDKDRIMFVKYHPDYKKIKIKLDKKEYELDKHFLGDISFREWQNIVKSNIAYDLSLNNKKVVEDVMKDGYIGNAVQFNKRTQVWMTNGWRGDKKFIQTYGKAKDLKLTKLGDYKASMIDDPAGINNILKAMNIHIPAGFDGAILATEATLDIMNRDAGHPYSGQNKSFMILKDPKNGTMLGKFMIHKVHPKMSEMMKEHNKGEGLNFLVMKSAIKQKADRGLKPGSYDLDGGKLNLHGDAKNIVEIDPSSFRYSHSVFQDNSMKGENHSGKYVGTKIVKQLMTQPHKDAFSKIEQRDLDDYYHELSQKSFDGKFEHNRLVDYYRKETAPEKREDYFNEILDNFENIGVEKVFEILRTPGEEKLSQEILLKILRTNQEAISTLSAASELSGSELESEIKGLVDFTGTADKIIKNLAALREEAYPLLFDKYTKDYVQKALDSYVADKILNPRVPNSLLARMRPYDIFLQEKFPELNTDAEAQKRWGKNADELFFLGDLYRDTQVRTVIKGFQKTTLGELWDSYQGKGKKRKLKGFDRTDAEEVFEAISVRVPQDSMSGAQVVHFRGFTGIKDHGILQHGRVLTAEGGADLDGDESFVYFGGKSENGIGHGMKKSFKDMFKAQKKEYYIVDKKSKVTSKEFSKYAGSFEGSKRIQELDRQAIGRIKDIEEAYKDEIIDRKSINENKKEFIIGRNYDEWEQGETFDTMPMSYKVTHSSKYGKFTAKEVLNKITSAIKKQTLEEMHFEVQLNREANLPNVKEMFADELLLTKKELSKMGIPPEIIDIMQGKKGSPKYSKYFPGVRLYSGEKGADGRNRLAPIVSMTQNMRAAWSAVSALSDKAEPITIERFGDFMFRTVRIAKPSSERQRLLSNALTAFGADPMDMTGLKDMATLESILSKSYFETKDQLFNKSTGKWEDATPAKLRLYKKAKNVKGVKAETTNFTSAYEKIKDFNRAFFGKNWDENKSWTRAEKLDMIEQINTFEPEQINTALPKFAQTLRGFDTHVNIFSRIEPKSVENLHKDFNEIASKMSYLKSLLGRTYLKVPESPLVKFIAEEGAYDKVVFDDFISHFKETDILMKKEYNLKPEYLDIEGKKTELSEESMRRFLNTAVLEADRRLADDLHDMTTLTLVNKVVEANRNNLPDELIKEISNAVESHKSVSVLNQIQRNSKGAGFGNETLKETRRNKIVRDLQLAAIEHGVADFVETDVRKPPSRERRTKLLDMGRLDMVIEEYKNNLPSNAARKLYDYLLIGSLRNKNIEARLRKIFKVEGLGLKDGFTRQLKDAIYQDGAKTSTTKLAYDSNIVAPESLQEFFSSKNKFFKKTMEEPTVEDVKNMKNFEKELDEIKPEKGVFGLKREEVDLSGYEGLKPGKNPLTSEQMKVVAELEQNLKGLPDYLKYDLNELVSGIYGEIEPVLTKSLNQMNVEDFKMLNRWFKMTREGLIFDQINKQVKEINRAKVSGWDFMIMPEQVTKRMMAHDMAFLRKKMFFQDNMGEVVEKRVLMPTYYGDTLRNMIGRLQGVEDGFAKILMKQFDNKVKFLEGASDGEAIWELAVRYHELQNKKESPIYQKQWDEAVKQYNWSKIKVKNHTTELNGVRDKFTGEQLLKEAVKRVKKFFDAQHTLITGEEGALDEYIRGYYDKGGKNPKLDWRLFLNRLNKAYEKGDDAHILESLKIGLDGFRHLNRSMMVDLLPPTEYIGKSGSIKGKKISPQEWKALPYAKQRFYRAGRAERAERYAKLDIRSTKYRKGYFPHYFLSKAKHKESKDFELNELSKSKKSLSVDEYQKKYRQILLKYKHRNGNWDVADFEMAEKMDNDLFGDTILGMANNAEAQQTNSAKLESVNGMFNNMQAREHHTGGYGVGVENIHLYLRNLSRTAFRQLANMTSRLTLHEMNKHMYKTWATKGSEKEKAEGRKLVSGWMNFWTLYAKRAMGMPTIISDAMYENPDLKLNASPFGWWADNRVANWANSVMETLGIAEKLPESMKFKKGEIDMEKMTAKEIEKVEKFLGKTAWDMQRWSNLEAKYELATLMTHPKTPINNIFGGTMHTFQAVGYEPLRKARSLKEIQKIIPELTSWDKVYEFVEKHGVVPEELLHQFGLEQQFQGGRAKAFVTEVANQATGLKGLKEIDIAALANKYGVTKAVVNVAAKFMSIPERMLRRDAFMAHYIKNWERLGGSIKNPENPILIELAKKGVKATQFLYNAAERPAFAATALGKVMSRFQLWAWNAFKFRNDVRKQGKLYGFKEGTEGMRKFERTMQVDMFVMALGSIFMYSLFGQIVPAPYNWLQDTAEWVFGDENERNKAFFGMWPAKVAPLQMVTPPIARVPISVIREFAEDDYTKLADYYVWSFFPFGRMIRDVAHPEKSILKNPMRVPEKVFGFPLTGLAKERKRMEEGKAFKPRTPGKSIL